MPQHEENAPLFVEDFFRAKWREIMAALTRRFGSARFGEIENAVQDAMERALATWPVAGVPENPGGWLYMVACNKILDGLKAETRGREKAPSVKQALYPEDEVAPAWLGPLEDDVLQLIFVCCHPRMNARESVTITLRYVCGLGCGEIAALMLSTEQAVLKQLNRTKIKIRDRPGPFVPPDKAEQRERMTQVLQIVYLLFSAGYSAPLGEHLVQRELCREAQRLIDLLLASHVADDGRVWALAALIAFQASRLPARADSDGRLLRLSEQDRTLWDQEQITRGMMCLERSMSGAGRSRYHLEAAIAACHAAAVSFEDTDWHRILAFYDDLRELAPSPIVEMNRAVAVMMVDGVDAGLSVLTALRDNRKLRDNGLFHSLLADFHRRAGDMTKASEFYNLALTQSPNTSLQRFLTDQMLACSVE